MSASLSDALDGARLVRAKEADGEGTELAVWCGGYMVQFYYVTPSRRSVAVHEGEPATAGHRKPDGMDRETARRIIQDRWDEGPEAEP